MTSKPHGRDDATPLQVCRNAILRYFRYGTSCVSLFPFRTVGDRPSLQSTVKLFNRQLGYVSWRAVGRKLAALQTNSFTNAKKSTRMTCTIKVGPRTLPFDVRFSGRYVSDIHSSPRFLFLMCSRVHASASNKAVLSVSLKR